MRIPYGDGKMASLQDSVAANALVWLSLHLPYLWLFLLYLLLYQPWLTSPIGCLESEIIFKIATVVRLGGSAV